MKLTERESHFLGLLMENGATISCGTSVGVSLYRRGLVHVARYGRWGITQDGVDAYRTCFAKAKARDRAEALKEAQLALI